MPWLHRASPSATLDKLRKRLKKIKKEMSTANFPQGDRSEAIEKRKPLIKRWIEAPTRGPDEGPLEFGSVLSLGPGLDNLVNEIDNIPVLHVKNLPNRVFPFPSKVSSSNGSGSHILRAPVLSSERERSKNEPFLGYVSPFWEEIHRRASFVTVITLSVHVLCSGCRATLGTCEPGGQP